MPETEALVINTGPLLALISGYGDLSLLNKIYKRILVPFEVCLEIEAGGNLAFGIQEFKKASFLEKQVEPLSIIGYLRNSLDLGEASVIQLALNENIQTVCIDEAVGRRVARLNGLRLTGSIGVLIRAKKIGGQRTEGRRRKAEGGGQRTVIGGLMGEKRISSFRELRVYQAAFELQQEIFEVTKGFPKAELYSLTD